MKQQILDMLARGKTTVEVPEEIKHRVDHLNKLNEERAEIFQQFLAEKAALERKYTDLYQPIFDKRAKVVSGEEAVPEASADGIPKFWLTVIKNHYMLNEMVFPADEEALAALKDVRLKNLPEGKTGFMLEFEFAANDYFENTLLTKQYIMVADEDYVLDHAEGSEIKWKADKCLTMKEVKKQQRNKAGNRRTVTKQEPQESFFNFFSPPAVPEEEELEEMEQEAQMELQSLIETDFEVGDVFRSKLIPNAVNWFTGEAAEEEEGHMFGDDDEDEDDEGDEEDEEDEEDEDEEEEGHSHKHKKGGKCCDHEHGPKKGKQGKKVAGEKAPECKEQ
eukprot:GILI01001077.1.p1 GENE.GILI01001077.1~~GILI01001077.1.p1  ORF type:complete len:362 (-),score=192.90 GILI01001077.1:319-1320(-)